MKRLVLLLCLAMLISACGSPPATVVVVSEVTRQVEATIEVTRLATVEVTKLATVEVTKVVVVTATYSGPTPTPEPTPTLAPSQTPRPTQDITKTDKRDGSYLVGSEIAPGIWRSRGGTSDEICWLAINTLSGALEDITGQLPGATIRIPAGDYVVLIGGGTGNKCTWYLFKP